MAKMQNPELEVVRFAAEDVIATSGEGGGIGGGTGGGSSIPTVLTISNFKNGTKADIVVNYGGVNYGADDSGTLISALLANGQTPNGEHGSVSFDFNNLLSLDKNMDGVLPNLPEGVNGTYFWTLAENKWVQQ